VIELDWQSSTTGSVARWIDEASQTTLTGFDNGARRIDRVRLGAVAGVDTTTNGTLYFDALESRRSTYIGPMPSPVVTTTISYVYDPLYRLKEANYSDGRYFHYTYDAVDNRLTETKCAILPCGTPITNTYTYDSANRLTSVNGQTYTWDNNGNLLNDGASTYVYDAANRLTSVVGGGNTSTYTYNGLGDRLSQTVNSVTTNYVLDLNAGLTQVLADGTNTYLYGAGRIGELQPGGFAYHLGDALGSVRQLTDGSGGVTLARNYEPYGSTLSSAGTGATTFAFTGEMLDGTGLQYHRARYLSSYLNQWIQPDTIMPDIRNPQTLNRYSYVNNNPINFTDPTGLCAENADESCWAVYEAIIRLCPECAAMERDVLPGIGGLGTATLGKTTRTKLHEEKIEYLKNVLKNVRSGWRPPSQHQSAYVHLGLTGFLVDGLVIGSMINFTGGPPGGNAVYYFAGGCQIPDGQVLNVVAFGEETVYDFVHRQRQTFQVVYYGIDPLQLVGIEGSWYEGITTGFRDVASVSDYGGWTLIKSPPAGISMGAVILEAGLGLSRSEALSDPGVDSLTVGLSLEFGVGVPGPGLEEGSSGTYMALAVAGPLSAPVDITSLPAMVNEIERSSRVNVFKDAVIDAARFWWSLDAR